MSKGKQTPPSTGQPQMISTMIKPPISKRQSVVTGRSAELVCSQAIIDEKTASQECPNEEKENVKWEGANPARECYEKWANFLIDLPAAEAEDGQIDIGSVLQEMEQGESATQAQDMDEETLEYIRGRLGEMEEQRKKEKKEKKEQKIQGKMVRPFKPFPHRQRYFDMINTHFLAQLLTDEPKTTSKCEHKSRKWVGFVGQIEFVDFNSEEAVADLRVEEAGRDLLNQQEKVEKKEFYSLFSLAL